MLKCEHCSEEDIEDLMFARICDIFEEQITKKYMDKEVATRIFLSSVLSLITLICFFLLADNVFVLLVYLVYCVLIYFVLTYNSSCPKKCFNDFTEFHDTLKGLSFKDFKNFIYETKLLNGLDISPYVDCIMKGNEYLKLCKDIEDSNVVSTLLDDNVLKVITATTEYMVHLDKIIDYNDIGAYVFWDKYLLSYNRG